MGTAAGQLKSRSPSVFLLLESVCVARPHRGFGPTTFQSEPDETDGFPQLAEKRGLD